MNTTLFKRKHVKIIAFILTAILVFASTVSVLFAGEADVAADQAVVGAESVEDNVVAPEALAENTVEVPEEASSEETTDEIVQTVSDGIHFYELDTASNSSAVLFVSNGETMLVCNGSGSADLVSKLQSANVSSINYLVLASSDGQDSMMQNLLDNFQIGHLYTKGNEAATALANNYGVDTTYAEYFYLGNQCIVLYADESNSIGVLVYDESHAIFVANALKDMSVLQGHQEISLIDILSISRETGTNTDVLTMMNPIHCVITGETPDTDTMSAFYGTDISGTGEFYITRNTPEGINIDLNSVYDIPNAAVQYLEISNPNPEPAPEEIIPEAEEDPVAVEESDMTEEEDLQIQELSNDVVAESVENADADLPEENVLDASKRNAPSESIVGLKSVKEPAPEETQKINLAQNNKTEELQEEKNDAPANQNDKTEAEVVIEAANGIWGRGSERYDQLTAAGYDAEHIQSMIDYIYNNHLQPAVAVTYFANGHGQDPEYEILKSGTTATEPEALSADGFVFTGWFTDAECTTKFDFTTPITANTRLYAGWTESTEEPVVEPVEETEFIITFEMMGHGSQINPQTVVKDDMAIAPKDPKEDGFVFEGWFVDEACETAYLFDESVTESFTLYAGWHEDLAEYIVQFDMNGHGTQIDDVTVFEGETLERPVDPIADGYYFTGWFTDKESTELFDFNEPITENRILYAGWEKAEPLTYTVNFNLGGHGHLIATQTITEGNLVERPQDPSADGYSFIGWFTDEAFQKAYDFNTKVDHSFTLFAQWEEVLPQTASVKFDMNGHGSALADQTVQIGSKLSAPADPTENGYVFDGWYADKNCEYKYNFDSPVNEDITLFAKWHAVSYTLRYDGNGGTGAISDTVYTIQQTAKIVKNSFTRDGYLFKGWNTKADGTGIAFQENDQFSGIDIQDGMTITLYAQWQPDYKFLEGNGQVVPAKTQAQFRTNGKLENLVSVSVDGNVVMSASYSMRPDVEGIYITLPAEYITGLSAGEHHITVTFKDGSCEGSFITSTVAATTGDTNHIVFLLLGICISLAVIIGVALILKKNRANGRRHE